MDTIDRKWVETDPGKSVFASDIPDHEGLEYALWNSESRYRELVENANSIIIRRNSAGYVTFCNEFAQKFFGYREHEILGKSIVGTIVPEVESTGRNLRRMIEDIGLHPDRYINNINENIRRNGDRVWIAWTNKPVYDNKGRVSEILCIGNDITARRQAEEALRESEQRLSDIIDFLPDATFVIDREGKVISWNQAIEEMTGIKAKDILGKGNYEYALPFYGIRRPILIDLAFRPDKDVEKNYHFVNKERGILLAEADVDLKGKSRVLWAKARPLYDSSGNIVGAIQSIRDVTERKQAENDLRKSAEELRKSKQMLEKTFASLREAVLIIDADSMKIVDCNPATSEMFGYTRGEVMGQTSAFLHVTEEALGKFREYLHPALETQGFLFLPEFTMKRKDGTVFPTEHSVTTLEDEKGIHTGWVSVIRDITDQVNSERERHNLEIQLRQAQKMEAIGTLAGGIAHDFNNILASIIGYTELAIFDGIPDEAQSNLEQVLKASERAKELVTQIMSFSRPDKSESKYLNISILIKESLKLLRPSLPSTIEIKRKIKAKSDTVFADPSHIHQIIMNLCTNSAHAMREKGGVLTVALTDLEIVEGDTSPHPDLVPGSYLVLSVSDTGHGIAPDIVERIFDPFFTTKSAGEGSGMGLAVVYGIVKSIGGAITVQSDPGSETSFCVYLPKSEHVKIEHADREEALLQGMESILLVDDEVDITTMEEELLQRLGYSIVSTTSSLEAVEIFRKRPFDFDLIMTDQTMPGMTGMDLAKEIKLIRHDIPIILCSGFSGMSAQENIRGSGISRFIMKPVHFPQLARVIREVLDKSREKGDLERVEYPDCR